MSPTVQRAVPLPLKIFRYMKQYPGTAFTEDDIMQELNCSPARMRWALNQLAEAELILLVRTLRGNPLYVAADSSDTDEQ